MEKSKILAGTVIAGLCASLTACSLGMKSQQPQNNEPTMEQNTGVANPMRSVNKDEFLQEIGVQFNVPEKADQVEYFVYDMGEEKLGEVQFDIDGTRYYLRVMSTDKTSIQDMDLDYCTKFTGQYFEWTTIKEGKVSYCDAKTFEEKEAKTIVWLDVVPGMVYSISTVNDKVSVEDLTSLANQCFVPSQGEH
ncbi:MAG: hypothetical protein Q4C49_09410 [Bacillota bacterium]|nr:hypothetical protein [Bacillota bacterium]